MVGYMNHCPKCGGKSEFVPEEMECDKSLVLWCNSCKEHISQTLTLQTLQNWWERYYDGEDDNRPPISEAHIILLRALEKQINDDPECYLDKVEIHFKDFNEYQYREEDQ